MSERRTKIAVGRRDDDGELVFRVEGKRWMRPNLTELRVGDWGLEAKGDLGGYKRGTLRLPWERVSELHYGPAGGGAIEGLYAREGEWCSRCVLPWLSEPQAEEVILAIAKCYPHVANNPESALETAVGEAMAQNSFVRRGWLPPSQRRSVAVAIPSGRV